MSLIKNYTLQTRITIGGATEYHIEDEYGNLYAHPVTKIPVFYDNKEEAEEALFKLNKTYNYE